MATRAPEEIAWAAGLFEGEGCIIIRQEHGRSYVRIVLGMMDKDVVLRFQEVIGGGHIHVSQRGGKSFHVLQLQKTIEAQDVLKKLMPWFGERRQKKAQEALKVKLVGHRESRKTHCKRGHEFNNVNTYKTPDGRRKCRECRRQYQRSK